MGGKKREGYCRTLAFLSFSSLYFALSILVSFPFFSVAETEGDEGRDERGDSRDGICWQFIYVGGVFDGPYGLPF